MSLRETGQILSLPLPRWCAVPIPRKMGQHPLWLWRELPTAHSQALASEKAHSWFNHAGTNPNKEEPPSLT